MGGIWIELLLIFVLILANGFFAASEISIVSARRSRLELQARTGNGAAKQALALSENPDRLLATVQVGISLIGTFAAAFGGARIGEVLAAWFRDIPSLAPYADTLGLGIVVVALTFASLILGELVPKRLGLQHAESMALLAAPIMTRLAWLARPIVFVLTGTVNLVLRLLRQHRRTANPVTEDDIVYLVQEGRQSGTVESGEAKLIHQVFRFTDQPVRMVMTPRTEMVALHVDTPLPEVIQAFVQSSYSRLPVYQETPDHIVGVLNAKDLLQLQPSGQPGPEQAGQPVLMRLVRPPIFVLEHQHVDDLLTMFRRQGSHLAVVVDEYGQVAGLVTLEDLLEELIGEIQDEYDSPSDHPFIQREDGSWLVDAMSAYERVQDRLGLPPIPADEQGDFTTLAGLILTRLNHIPDVGETVSLGDFLLEVVDMDQRRIDKVLIRRAGGQQEPPAAANVP